MSSDGNRVELEGVTLKLFTKDAKNFDEVKSAKADFDTGNGLLVSEGEVEITRGVQTDASGSEQEIRQAHGDQDFRRVLREQDREGLDRKAREL